MVPQRRQRFVQLPADADRASDAMHESAFASPVEILAPAGAFDPAQQAQIVGAVLALLHRYTLQDQIALDVSVRAGGAERWRAIDVGVAGDCATSSLIDEARAALDTAAAGAADTPDEPSNVAVTFVVAPLDRGGWFDVEACVGSAPARYDAHFVFARRGEAHVLALAYDAARVGPSTAARLTRSAEVVFAAAWQDPTTAVARLPLLHSQEIRALTVEQDSGTASYAPVPVHRRFEALAQKQPAAIAATFQQVRITYAELDEQSNRLAHYLVARGVGAEVPVAVCVRPSLDVLVAMLAIWKAGGVYLPLDPTHPEALIGRMLDEARPRLVLTSAALSGLTAKFPQVRLDADAGRFEKCSPAPLSIEASLRDPAYVFYTSGTSGKPKGVVATQGNLAQFVHSAAQRYGFRADDVFVSLARYTFSISLFELVSPLCCGGTLRILERDEVLTPERLLRALEDVTVVHAGPSLLGSLFRYVASASPAPRSLPRMRHASSGGDMVSPSTMEGMKNVFPNAELFVIYGCTEVSCMGTTFAIPRNAAVSRTFVGKPFPNVTSRVLDSHGSLVPFGVVGDICFAGDGVVRGYLDRPDLTAEKFVELGGRRFYRTGDLGRLHADGHLEILGRGDFQVKVRGIRVELAGIENTVLELGLAAQCAVVARTVAEGDVRLVAFVVKPTGDGVVLRRALAAQLPDCMVPNHVVVLDAMPLTANGKLDRNQLKEAPWEPLPAASGRTAPADPREQGIADAFARVLGVREVAVDQSFFDLGGDSLLGIVLLDEIARTTGIAIPPQVLFDDGTVRALASRVQGDGLGVMKPIPLHRSSSGPPLFMLSGVHIYRELARRLEGLCTPYGVFARGEIDPFLDSRMDFQSVEEMAQEYVESIRRQQPAGPYRLLGYSFGGIIAYEVAQRLRAAGEDVPLLALVDAPLPEWALGWRFRASQVARLRSVSVRDLLTFVGRRLKVLPSPPEFVQPGSERLGPRGENMDALKRTAAAQYLPRIRPFAGGQVTLFVARERLRADPLKSASCGWEAHVESLSVHEVNADHFGMMSDEPYVSQLAEVLARRLADAGPTAKGMEGAMASRMHDTERAA